MTGRVYYNENDRFAAQWIREMIGLGVLPGGVVDDRSIKEVSPDDLKGFVHCHFFAGIGGWAYAARLADWPVDLELWSGSAPCQPFSDAGEGRGFDDPRDLWPDFDRLVGARRPARVVGEQVAKKAGRRWLDRTRVDLARRGYAFRAVDIPACAVDAPILRQRHYWCAVAGADGERPGGRAGQPGRDDGAGSAAGRREGVYRLANGNEPEFLGGAGGAGGEGWQGIPHARGLDRHPTGRADAERADRRNRRPSFWSDAEWIACHDGQARRTKPGLPLLAHGVRGRVPKWRGFGNAISPPEAAEVLGALLDVIAASDDHLRAVA